MTNIAAGVEGSNPLLNILIFAAFVVVTLVIVFRASRNTKTASDYYAAGRAFTGPQNGIAISGDYLSAASFLGIAGAIAINGYDGFLYSIGFLVAWLVALLLVAELLRNTGKFTMGDVLAFRMKQRPVRAAAATSTLAVSFFYLLAQMAGAGGLVALLLVAELLRNTGKFTMGDVLAFRMKQRPVRAAAATSTLAVSFFYLLAQMAGAGGLVALLLGVEGGGAQAIVIAVVGIIMIAYVLIGGMKGTTWVQIIKAALLIVGALVITLWVLGKYNFNFSTLLQAAVDKAGKAGETLLGPGKQYGATGTSKLDFFSLGIALVLGTAGLPHVLMRFYTVPTARDARRSVVWAIVLIGVFYLFTLVLGYGAGALVGPDTIKKAPGGVNSAAPLLALELGGPVLLGLISAVAFATILAVVAGLTITASASFAHDVYANVVKRGKTSPDSEVKVARITAVVIGALAIGGGILANGQNVAFLVALAFAVAASANLPTILYSLFWKRFNTQGALWSIYGGLAITIVLIVFSPAVSGKSTSMIKTVDFAWFPLSNPGIVSIPAAFILGWLGTVLSKEHDEKKYAEMEVRSLTGAGAEKAVVH
ncbi:solute symporter family protein [Amycolatopsis sp. MEPSY49]|uniref:solute symporter family protein n=1 Tax=Amycolatopsis sp. MEPSY49 TaxID=3151600 RepID=UPI003EF212A6